MKAGSNPYLQEIKYQMEALVSNKKENEGWSKNDNPSTLAQLHANIGRGKPQLAQLMETFNKINDGTYVINDATVNTLITQWNTVMAQTQHSHAITSIKSQMNEILSGLASQPGISEKTKLRLEMQPLLEPLLGISDEKYTPLKNSLMTVSHELANDTTTANPKLAADHIKQLKQEYNNFKQLNRSEDAYTKKFVENYLKTTSQLMEKTNFLQRLVRSVKKMLRLNVSKATFVDRLDKTKTTSNNRTR